MSGGLRRLLQSYHAFRRCVGYSDVFSGSSIKRFVTHLTRVYHKSAKEVVTKTGKTERKCIAGCGFSVPVGLSVDGTCFLVFSRARNIATDASCRNSLFEKPAPIGCRQGAVDPGESLYSDPGSKSV